MNDDMIRRSVQSTRKDPWLAVLLSKVFPGAGHIYGGAKARGVFIIAAFVAAFMILAFCGIAFLTADNAQDTRFYAIAVLGETLIMFAMSILVYFDAYRITKRHDPELLQAVTEVGARKAWLAAFLSALLPGVGQLYNRQIMKGLGFFVLLFAAGVLQGFFMPLFTVAFIVSVLGIKDAYDSAERINRSPGRFFEQKKTIVLLVLVMVGMESLPLAQVIKNNFVEAFKMPSGSMLPSMKIGDHFLIGKSRPFYAAPRRGDIVVFPYPENPTKNFVKRVIGLGGDKIQFINGELYINDRQVVTRLVGVDPEDEALHLGGSGPPTIYEEKNGDAVYSVQYLRDRSTHNEGPWLVPEDSLFVMGDNRDNSQDSRAWGPVKSSTVMGKALKIYWSWDAGKSRVRWDRVGMLMR